MIKLPVPKVAGALALGLTVLEERTMQMHTFY